MFVEGVGIGVICCIYIVVCTVIGKNSMHKMGTQSRGCLGEPKYGAGGALCVWSVFALLSWWTFGCMLPYGNRCVMHCLCIWTTVRMGYMSQPDVDAFAGIINLLLYGAQGTARSRYDPDDKQTNKQKFKVRQPQRAANCTAAYPPSSPWRLPHLKCFLCYVIPLNQLA